jgi:peptidyl-prolyl cis-trans isomerase SurA
MPKQIKTWLTAAALSAGVLGLAACGGSSDDAGDSVADTAATATADPGDPATETAPAVAEPDVSDVPDVVAEVNGEEITAEEFVTLYESQYARVAQQSPTPVDQDELKLQTLDSMIGSELLVQTAEDRGISPTQDEVDASLEELAAGYGLESPEQFLELLQEQGGLTDEEARAEVETQVKVDTLIAEEATVEDPSEEDLRDLYDSLVGDQEGAAQEAEVPPFEEVRDQLAEQLRGQREADAVSTLVEDLREDADIVINL